MKANKWLPAMAVVVLTLVVAVVAQTQKPAATRGWEYSEVKLSELDVSTPTLNRYGAEGWELVNVTAGCITSGSPSSGVTTTCHWYGYFKRQKQ